MAQMKLSAPVGQAPRTSPGAKVANKFPDIFLVQRMLSANGYPTPTTGKMNGGLIKAIGAAQKKLTGAKAPDFVVDPGGKLEKALMPKFQKEVALDKKDPLVRLSGTDIIVRLSALQKEKAKLLKHMAGIHKILVKSYAVTYEAHLECLRAGAYEKSLLEAISTAVVVAVGRIKLPSQAVMRNAESAVDNLGRAIRAKDLVAVDNAMYEADRCLQNYDKEMYRYYSQLSRTAWYVGTTLNVTNTVGWTIVGAMATPIAVTAGAGTVGAMAVSGAGVAGMQAAVKEIGTYAYGKPVTLFGSMYNVMVDGAVGGVTGAIGGALPEPFKKTIGRHLGGKVAGKISALAGDKAEKVIIEWLSHGGAEVAAEALGAAVKLLGATAKSGKLPTQKEFEAATCDILFKAMGSNFLKMLGGLEKSAANSGKAILTDRMMPEWLNKFAKEPVPPEVRKKIAGTVVTKMNENAAKLVFDYGVSNLKGKDNAQKLLKQGTEKTLKDKKLARDFDKLMRAEMKKHKCMVK